MKLHQRLKRVQVPRVGGNGTLCFFSDGLCHSYLLEGACVVDLLCVRLSQIDMRVRVRGRLFHCLTQQLECVIIFVVGKVNSRKKDQGIRIIRILLKLVFQQRTRLLVVPAVD
jgi:hypothetical protein